MCICNELTLRATTYTQLHSVASNEMHYPFLFKMLLRLFTMLAAINDHRWYVKLNSYPVYTEFPYERSDSVCQASGQVSVQPQLAQGTDISLIGTKQSRYYYAATMCHERSEYTLFTTLWKRTYMLTNMKQTPTGHGTTCNITAVQNPEWSFCLEFWDTSG
jgi:hypothetical protein